MAVAGSFQPLFCTKEVMSSGAPASQEAGSAAGAGAAGAGAAGAAGVGSAAGAGVACPVICISPMRVYYWVVSRAVLLSARIKTPRCRFHLGVFLWSVLAVVQLPESFIRQAKVLLQAQPDLSPTFHDGVGPFLGVEGGFMRPAELGQVAQHLVGVDVVRDEDGSVGGLAPAQEGQRPLLQRGKVRHCLASWATLAICAMPGRASVICWVCWASARP